MLYSITYFITLCIVMLLVSLPWMNAKRFGIFGAYRAHKSVVIVILESLFIYSLLIVGVITLEAYQGVRFEQGWQFWVVLLCLWTLLIFPALAWFKLR